MSANGKEKDFGRKTLNEQLDDEQKEGQVRNISINLSVEAIFSLIFTSDFRCCAVVSDV